ncbi:MAG: hypothetical protein QFF03_12100 [Pseudomonadota bacterium]|nr:hypothetical protein [Pseudomonadota bacterium]
MSCCGNHRQQLTRREAATPGGAAPPEPAARPLAPGNGVLFAYYGANELVLNGAVSGRRYRFAERGARLAIDPRDAPALAAHPRLRRITP